MSADVEAAMARRIVRRVAVVGPLVVGGAALVRGGAGALAAALAVAVIALNFLAAGLMMSAAARHSLALYHAAALFGFVLRLALITATMIAVAELFALDRVTFGVAAVASYLVLVTLEAVAVAREAEGKVQWTS